MKADRTPTEFADSKVLIVEDEANLAASYEAWLSEEHEIVTTHTARQGKSLLDDSVDIVLVDRRLPYEPGSHVLDCIQYRDLECMVTMVRAVQPEFEMDRLPFDEYLVKPIAREELRATVDELLLRSSVDIDRQELLSLLSRKIALEDENSHAALAEAPAYQQLQKKIQLVNAELEVSPQAISSRHRPDTCPDCGLRWNLDLEGTVGFIDLASGVWKCIECGEAVHVSDPSNRSVARGR